MNLLKYICTLTLFFSSLNAAGQTLPPAMVKIMDQPKYRHAFWGIFAKDSETGEVIYELNSEKLLLPASTTKCFSVGALLNAYGDNYRFKTPVIAQGTIQNGKLQGNLILVAQGDLTMGGRQDGPDTIAYTKLDHIVANNVPGVILTPQNPLHGLDMLAKQIHEKGIKEINGNVLIDDSLFPTTEKRDFFLAPIFINENLIDIVIHPKKTGEAAELMWRPQVDGYTVKSEVKTGPQDMPLEIQVSEDEKGRNIVVSGIIPERSLDVVRTVSIQDPGHFARLAFIQALERQGIAVHLDKDAHSLPNPDTYKNLEPLAVWTSPPLSEYAKLILKVSHNIGADLIPFLLALKEGKSSFDDGMKLLGKFVTEKVKVSKDAFVFIDAAGSDTNRLTPEAEVQMMDYMRRQSKDQFGKFFDALPVLGVNGSLEDFGKKTDAVGKIRAKPGTGVAFNTASSEFFLTTQTLVGYIEGRNGHLIEYFIGVNNGQMPVIDDIFPIFEDACEMSAAIYDMSN